MTAPLDGLSVAPTGAWSFGRKLLSAYGGAYSATTSGNYSTLYDQSGSARDMADGGTAARRPSPTTMGTGGVPAALFNGSANFLSSSAISNFIANNAAFAIISVRFVALTGTDSRTYANNGFFADPGGFFGLYAKSTGPTVMAFDWDGTDKHADSSVSTGTDYIVTLRHDSGNLYVGVNGTESGATAAGNTTTLTGALQLGRGWTTSNIYCNCRVAEAAIWNAIPTLTERSNVVTNFSTYLTTPYSTGGVGIRRSLSSLGTRIGSRQTHRG